MKDQEKETQVSRRNFLAGASKLGFGVLGIAASGAALTSLVGCVSNVDEEYPEGASIQTNAGGSDTAHDAPDITLADNQFSGTATGMHPGITVIITVDGGKITDASVDTSQETAGIGQELGPDFAKQIIANGKIDAKSGATITSNAVEKALAAALQAAGL